MRRRRLLAATAAAVTVIVSGWAALTTPIASAEADRPLAAPAGSPVAVNGALSVCGVNLCNQAGEAIQLRGMSSHGIQFFPKCLNPASLAALRNDWKADFVRIAMYVQEGGYETNPSWRMRCVPPASGLARTRARGSVRTALLST